MYEAGPDQFDDLDHFSLYVAVASDTIQPDGQRHAGQPVEV